MNFYDKLTKIIKNDNQRMYETVGQPVPDTVTAINEAETAIGFQPSVDTANSVEIEAEPATPTKPSIIKPGF